MNSTEIKRAHIVLASKAFFHLLPALGIGLVFIPFQACGGFNKAQTFAGGW